MPPTNIPLADHSSRRPRPKPPTAPPVINMPNRHRRMPPNDGRKIGSGANLVQAKVRLVGDARERRARAGRCQDLARTTCTPGLLPVNLPGPAGRWATQRVDPQLLLPPGAGLVVDEVQLR